MITCKSGVTIRMNVSRISSQGRATQGVKLIRLDEGDEIAAITRLNEEQPEVNAEDVQLVESGIDNLTAGLAENGETVTGEQDQVTGDSVEDLADPDLDAEQDPADGENEEAGDDATDEDENPSLPDENKPE